MQIGARFNYKTESRWPEGVTVETFYRVINGQGYEFYRQVNMTGFRVLWVFKNDAPIPVKSFMGVPE